jgi:hypothetical protein
MNCPICGSDHSTFCEHDLAYLESVAKLYANHQRWREETRQQVSGGGQLAHEGVIPLQRRATSPPRKIKTRRSA